MEKFILLFRGSDAYRPGESAETLEVLKHQMIGWLTDLSERGIHVASEPMEQSGKQVNGVSKTVIDRPYGEGREVIGGCTIVRANHIDDALEIAKSCPILGSNGKIEVRPIQRI